MYYGEIKNCDIANGEGVRVTLFVSGCTNRCKNCFQPQTWAFDYGQPFTAETEEALLQMLAPAYINGLTLLGGEPFEPENQRGLLPFLRRVRERLPGKTIWAFTGFTWEQLHTDGSHPAARSRTSCSRSLTCSWTGALWRNCTTSRSASAARATSASSTCRARCRAAASHSGRINKPWLKSRSRS